MNSTTSLSNLAGVVSSSRKAEGRAQNLRTALRVRPADSSDSALDAGINCRDFAAQQVLAQLDQS